MGTDGERSTSDSRRQIGEWRWKRVRAGDGIGRLVRGGLGSCFLRRHRWTTTRRTNSLQTLDWRHPLRVSKGARNFSEGKGMRSGWEKR